MHWEFVVAILLIALPVCRGAFAENGNTLDVWAVDPLEKVFHDTLPAADDAATHHAARGETVDFQIALRSSVALNDIQVAVASFAHETNGGTLPPAQVRFIGFVHVDRPTQRPSSDQLRKPPYDYPDVLLEDVAPPIAADATQPLWISLEIPTDAAPGAYVSAVTISSGGQSREFPLTVQVYPVTVGKARLWVTNWFSMQWRHLDIAPEPDSEEYYALMRRYAANMAAHRQNVALISPITLAEYGADENGALTFDFSRFDRWVEIFIEEGVIGRIEGGHIGGRKDGWLSQFVTQTRVVRDGAVVSESVAPDSDEARAFYSAFFPALVSHLKQRGWLDMYMQHLADEPIVNNLDTYRALAKLARDYAPELRIIEATHSKDLIGAIDIWVPQLNYLHDDFAHYQERQEAGDEIWFYTCVFPQGEYANRFIEQPLIKTRLLHWINFNYDVTGYLHWGYNHWTDDDPVTHTTRPHGGPPYLPAGDPWIVYPGKNGPLSSIRLAAMRDGVADHELLSILAEQQPEKAKELAKGLVQDFDAYNTSIAAFRETRLELLRLLAEDTP